MSRPCKYVQRHDTLVCILTEFLSTFSLHACAHICVFVCVFPCFTRVHAPRGKQAVWGVICLCRGWQLITNPDKHWGSEEGREEGEEMALGWGIGIWIPLSNHRALWILSSQPLYEFGPEPDNCTASHLDHWWLIIPRQYTYTSR